MANDLLICIQNSSEQNEKLVYVIAWVAVKFKINTTSVVLEMGQISRGEAEWNYPFPIQQEWYLSQIFTAIPMLFHVNTILADFC